MAGRFQVTFDAADPTALGAFWALALNYVQEPPPEGFANWDDALRDMGIPEHLRSDYYAVVDPQGIGPRLYFQRVPERKVAKNRVHLDIGVGSGADSAAERARLQDARVEELVAAGATKRHVFEEFGGRFVVMHDPEGNEFCVC
jgi:hypothetical protein